MMDCHIPRRDTNPMRGLLTVIETLRQDQAATPRPYAVALVEAAARRNEDAQQ